MYYEGLNSLKCVRVCVSLPETELGGLRTEFPSGGLSPTMLGSWALGGGEYAGGLGPCSWSNFFGTSQQCKRKIGEGG